MKGFVDVERFMLVKDRPWESWDIIVEVRRGDAFQIYRKSFRLDKDEDDIRAALGIALESIGAEIQRSNGLPLVSVFTGGIVKVEEVDD